MRDENWDRDINDWALGKAFASDCCMDDLKDRLVFGIGSCLAA